MTDTSTTRRYRPDPSKIGQPEEWGAGRAKATLTSNAIIIAAEGEFDASNTPQLSAYVERHQFLADRLYLDMRDVTFCASAGLAVLYRVKHRCDEHGMYWRLLAGPAVRKLLRICDVRDLPQLANLDGVLGRSVPRRAAMATLAAAGRRWT
jgi:anti-anti-sigma factor